MLKYRKSTRFFAAMLVVGGVAGIVIVALMGFQLVQKGWVLLVPVAALVALFAWAAFTGVRLWQGTPYGRKWAPILYGSQIPILSAPGVTYHWCTGVQFGPILRISGGAVHGSFTFNIGANGEFFVGSDVTEILLGINLFAVVALVLLVVSNKSFKSNSLRPSA